MYYLLYEKLFATLIKIIHGKYNLQLLVSGTPCKKLGSCDSVRTTNKKLKYQQLVLDSSVNKVTGKTTSPQSGWTGR